MDPTLAWKLATVDPAAARRVIEGLLITKTNPQSFLFIALGAKERHEEAAVEAFQIGVKRIDQLLQETPERYQIRAGTSLPIVERFDSALVPEVFWLDVSSRLPASNPRMRTAGATAPLIERLACYDREVAAALFEPTRVRFEGANDVQPANLAMEFLAWSAIDPHAAVARLEKLPIDPRPGSDSVRARLVVAESLAQDHEQRWRRIWRDWDMILGGTKRRF